MKKSLVYLDSSAYLAAILDEPEGAGIRTLSKRYALCSSILLILEVQRNLIRLAREKVLSEVQYQQCSELFRKEQRLFLFKYVDKDIVEDALIPAVKIPRTLDLVHLRSARWFAQRYQLDGFVTFDDHHRSCAEELGIKIFSIQSSK